MNKERINELADRIDAVKPGDEIGFNMDNFISTPWRDDEGTLITPKDFSGAECGTACCIAGWIALGHEEERREKMQTFTEFGSKHLGIGWEIGYALFHPDEDAAWNATPQQAAKVLRILAATGRVDWETALAAE